MGYRGNQHSLHPRKAAFERGPVTDALPPADSPNADFLLSFTPGNFYFTVRALKNDAEDHLTVIYNRKAYVLQLSASKSHSIR